MVHCLFELAGALGIEPEKLLPPPSVGLETRVEVVIGELNDPSVAQFVKAGLEKAKVLRK